MKRFYVISILWIVLLGFQALYTCPVYAYIDETKSSFENFSAYKPNYFLLGTPDVKAQFSLKLQPIDVIPLYFSYSQLVMWDLFKYSSPIRDINYNPEVFYRVSWGDAEFLRSLDFSPFEHESNGNDGSDSRSWNRAYVRFSQTVKSVHWSLKLWLPYTGDSNELVKTRGLGELTITLSDFLGTSWKKADLTLRIYPGGESMVNPLQGGQEITFRIKAAAPDFLPLLVFQFFHGYGENLLDFRNERFGLRAGMGL